MHSLRELFRALTWKAVFVWLHRIAVLGLFSAAVPSALFLLCFYYFSIEFLFSFDTVSAIF